MTGPIVSGLYKTRGGPIAQVLTSDTEQGVTGTGPFFAHGKIGGVPREVMWDQEDGRFVRRGSGGPHYNDLVEQVKTVGPPKGETMGGDGPPPDEAIDEEEPCP